MEKNSATKSFLSWLGGICAFLTVIVYGVLIIHANWSFIPDNILNYLFIIRTWAPLVIVGITGLEFTQGKPFLIRIIFLALMAVVVISMFFPTTWNSLVGFVNGN